MNVDKIFYSSGSLNYLNNNLLNRTPVGDDFFNIKFYEDSSI